MPYDLKNRNVLVTGGSRYVRFLASYCSFSLSIAAELVFFIPFCLNRMHCTETTALLFQEH